VVQVTLLLAPAHQYAALATIVLALAIVALAVFRWVARHHQRALERSLVRRASRAVATVGRDLLDTTTFPIFTDAHAIETAASSFSAELAGPETARREELASNDVARVIRALEDGPLPTSLIPDVVPLLAWDEVAAPGIRALRSVAADAMPRLVEWLLDPETPARVRRRLVVVLGTCQTPEARDGLLEALRDPRFEVRYRSSRALVRLKRLDPVLAPTREQMLPIIGAELDQGQSLVQGRRAVELLPEEEEDRGLLGEVLRERRDQVLEHLFTMLGFCFPGEPLTVALRGVRSRDEHLRATAFEYLESTLPGDLRRRLWPILDAPPIRRPSSGGAPREAIDSLLSARDSIAFRVDELRAQLEDLERRQPGKPDRQE
jgi:hypothetical protein